MSQPPLTRQQGMMWGGGLFILSVLGTAFVVWWKYLGQGLWLGVPLYAALFACGAVMGTRADPREIRRSLGAGILTLVQPAPYWALGVIGIELVLAVFGGWMWWWRSILPLAAGIVAGYKWPREAAVPVEPAAKEEGAPPPMDLWKP